MREAPDFTLLGQDDHEHSLSDYHGHWVVLYVYPKDDTPGCTAEACAFRDEHEAIAATTNATVIGVSTDSVESHKRFANKYHLSFTLLSDPDHALIQALGSWDNDRSATLRNTYIINANGEIVRSYEKVDPASHVPQILKDLPELMTSTS